MLALDEDPGRRDLRVGGQVLDAVDAPERDVRLLEARLGLFDAELEGARGGARVEDLAQLVAMTLASGDGGEARVARHVAHVERAAESLELARPRAPSWSPSRRAGGEVAGGADRRTVIDALAEEDPVGPAVGPQERDRGVEHGAR